MSQLLNGPITSNDLMQRLAQAKKVMNKVDSGNYEKGNVSESAFLVPQEPAEYKEQQVKPVSIDKIQNPIPQISLSESLDMDFVKGAKKLMEREGLSKPTIQQKNSGTVTNPNIDMNAIATLIENTVRKVMDEKLNQILTAQQTASINENLVLKVGDSIFKGKITGVNKAK
jgi:DNA-binding transcriptional regulator YdaS (Cro superfamily)